MKYISKYLFVVLLFLCSQSVAVADEPHLVAEWDFATEATRSFESHGSVQRDQAGPRPPVYPDFQSNNTAIRLGESGGYLSIDDTAEQSEFDFTNGDAITLEAWVKIQLPANNSPIYIVGKGRTGNPRFSKDNQNWAMRVQKVGNSMRVGFLFATKRGEGDAHWHRWTSTASFTAQNTWHHVAVTYRYGDPDSMRGWIDGKPTDGDWGMGGKTTEPPIVDDDQVWIGSANHGNRFVGLIDNVAVYRGLADDSVIASRFRRIGEESKPKLVAATMPELGEIPPGRVLVTMGESLPAEDRWIMDNESWPSDALRWHGDAFLIHQLPVRYDTWGIRDAWREPVLLRMAADVEFAPGTHRLLMRARGMGRLWIDGKIAAQTKPVSRRSPDGEQPITPVAEPPLPGVRPHGYHQQEVFAEWTIPEETTKETSTQRVVLELIVGGKNQRTETGEVCIAVQTADGTSYDLLGPKDAEVVPLTDAAVERLLGQMADQMTAIDDASRRTAAASQDDYWNKRHQSAVEWAEQHPVPAVPTADGDSTTHPVDAFIANKIRVAIDAAAKSDSKVTEHFHGKVLPILRDQCFRCHGEKDKGGLKLNSREAVLMAGESELPAVVPGDADASELISQIRSGAMPPTDTGLSDDQIATLEQWIRDGAVWPAPAVDVASLSPPPVVNDESFLRRAYLDTVGVPPTLAEANAFLADNRPDKRERLIDDLLDDERMADHWISLWQDLLAENPTLLNQSMGSTGPFRWFLYDSLRDNKPIDRMVTELIMMRGSPDTGGSAGFRLSGESDAPYAEKANILAAAFLGVDLQCARCHDSPYHSTLQRDLYSLSAMLERKTVQVPKTSRVPDAFFEKKGRESLIRVTLKPNESIRPEWPLGNLIGVSDNEQISSLMMKPSDSRERLAVLMTAPQNRRFGRVMINRVWKKLMGAGIVEPVSDWEGQIASHPELLDWMVHQWITSGYDLQVVMRQIMTSETYQREALGKNLTADAEQRFFSSPDRRRLTAEQVVDSLYVACGSRMNVEELTFVHDGQRPIGKRQSMGVPKRAWMFASLNNERDRPSLSLPSARAVTDVLQAFGWNGSRQKPISVRDTDANVLQPGILSNGTLSISLSRASVDSDLSRLAIEATSPESLVDTLFLRFLCRQPTPQERIAFVNELSVGFEQRIVPEENVQYPEPLPPLPQVTWFNHLRPETNTIQQELERRVSLGPPADPRIESNWRAVYEDFAWSLINHREFVWVP
ncbi:secreted protein containing DUF1549 [Rhodopirellula maiorica SM1]|uniref:Secreted protein containing DUF1549 n=1 Tax=Rhodopirellula maiorica SM1 TaxID=1265738 RepID=M5R911_9BACT|nr:DUF1553 domain-containing protein [Rhodopirellula maiorica]EMI15855.1 secreted protein containing DUF1549 [Rhodopirellula maiorica SM1]